MAEIENEIPQSEEDVDSLLEGITAPEGIEAAPQSSEQSAEQARLVNEFIFRHGDKEIKLDLAKDRDKLARWAAQGYDAPNKIGELNKTLESYKTRESQYKEWQEKYGPVDEYVRQNPQFWEHVQNTYQQLQQQQSMNPLSPVVEQLQKRLEGLEGLAQTFQSQREQEISQKQDQEYMSELETIQKQYPTIDLSTPDESGQSLEYKVLKYAQENGIRKFTTAFRDFHHDELMKLKEEQGKEKVIKDKQAKSKLGILGISPTPTRRMSNNVKGKSYADIAREAEEEWGVT